MTKKKTPTEPTIKWLDPNTLDPDAGNPRVITPENRDKLRMLLQKFGLVENLVLNTRNNELVSGHQRRSLAIELGIEKVPVMLVDLPEAEAHALGIALNNAAAQGAWNDELLGLRLADLQAFDVGSLTAFDADELQALTATEVAFTAKGGQGDEPTEPPVTVPENPVTQPGDMWTLGNHRVVCGDSSDPAAWKALGASSIGLVITSPPYADRRKYDPDSGFEPIHPDKYLEWWRPIAHQLEKLLAADGSLVVNLKAGSDGQLDTETWVHELVLDMVKEQGWHLGQEFCWERSGIPSHSKLRLKSGFELLYQFTRGRWKFNAAAVRHPSKAAVTAAGPGSGESWATKRQGTGADFIEPDRQGDGLAYPSNRLPQFAPSPALGHPAVFPIGLPRFFIRLMTDPDDLVADPFAGSGSTLMAADLEGRRSVHVEKSAAYCDVIVERWRNQTGNKGRRKKAAVR